MRNTDHLHAVKPLASLVMLCCSLFISSAQAQRSYSILDFGAKPGLAHVNTVAMQRAIDVAAAQRKGGRVVIPADTFVTGTLMLKSNVELYLSRGAVLLGSLHPEHYPRYGKQHALLMATSQQQIRLSGKGTIDGCGLALALAIDSLHHTGIRPDSNYNYRRMRPAARPMVIDFYRCRDIRVSGITIKDSPGWVQHYVACEDLVIDSVHVQSVAYWNNDGIDLTGCRRVRITHCDVNAADDGICLKSELPEQVNEDIYIGQCRIRSSASAVKFGTASAGPFRNIVIEDITVYDTYRSAIALEAVDGGSIDQIQVRRITATNTGNALFIRLGHRNKDSRYSSIRQVTVQQMHVQIPFERPDLRYDVRGPDLPFFHNPFPSSITGLPGHVVENIVLEDIDIRYPGRGTPAMGNIPIWRLQQVPENEADYPEFSMFGELPAWAFYVRHVRGVSFRRVKVTLDQPDYRPAYVFDDVKGLSLMEMRVLPAPTPRSFVLKDTDNPQTDATVQPYLLQAPVAPRKP